MCISEYAALLQNVLTLTAIAVDNACPGLQCVASARSGVVRAASHHAWPRSCVKIVQWGGMVYTRDMFASGHYEVLAKVRVRLCTR